MNKSDGKLWKGMYDMVPFKGVINEKKKGRKSNPAFMYA